jgi:hypothetical protein
VVIIDSDVLLLSFAFKMDARQKTNSLFINKVQGEQPAITIYNLMEILGQLSFNISPVRLSSWQSWLVDAYQLTLIWPVDPSKPISAHSFREEIYERPLARMKENRMPFLDALVIDLAERTPDASCFVTWNARHFQGKTRLKMLTPKEYLDEGNIPTS